MGANLFVGNLDENVDERLLYDTFSAFGIMATTAKVCNILHFLHYLLIYMQRLPEILPAGLQRVTDLYPTLILRLPMLL